MISVDEFIHKKAQEKRLNISGICEDALRKNTVPEKTDAPDDALVLKCTQCGEIVEYGFLCEERNLFLCQKCQDNFNVNKCPHDKFGEHSHIRIPDFNGVTDKNKIKRHKKAVSASI